MASECDNPIGGFTSASEVVVEQFDFFTGLVNTYLAAANNFSQQLEAFDITPVNIAPPNWSVETGFAAYEKPDPPEGFTPPNPQFGGSAPPAPPITPVNTSGFPNAPNVTAPVAPSIVIPLPPIVALPSGPGDAPVLSDIPIPVYEGGPLPAVPTLVQLNLPDAPDINIDDLDIIRPNFVPPGVLQDVYTSDFNLYANIVNTGVLAEVDATGVTDMHPRLQAMLAGGTGLPVSIEQALFDRAIGRDEVSTVQAVAQTESEWSAKGFALPGATLLARVQEIRQAGLAERGRINREISIQFHTQEIENLRFSVEQAISLEGTLLQSHIQIFDAARQLADGHWVVAKGIYESQLAIFSLQLEIYKTDVEVYKTTLEAELVKLEIYRSELEAQKLIGDINQQYVDIYTAELQGVLASVEVFKAQVGAAEAQIRAELSKIEVFKAEIDAYTAELGAVKVEFDIYGTRIEAEQAKASVYTSQVDAYGKRIEAYRTEVGAEASKVEARTSAQESSTRVYAETVNAWSAGIAADTATLEANVQAYRAELEKYTALLSAEQYRVTGEARNFELDVESEKARVAALLKQSDQSIEQMKHATEMGLSATEIAAKVNSQLAASAMSAISVSAGMSSGNTVSASDTRSCTTSYAANVNV